MRAITRPRIFLATGLLGVAALLGTTAAATPAFTGSHPVMHHEGTAMQGEGAPAMQGEIVLAAMVNHAQPGMQQE